MCEVIYFSRSGNTKQLATAIAGELDVKARHIRSVESLPEAETLFLGSGLYFLRPSKMVRDFIRTNDFRGRKIALFGTSTTGIGIEIWGMERLLKRKGATITGKYYCAGKFFIRLAGKYFYMRKDRPASEDLEKARSFARSIRNGLYDTQMVAESQRENREDRILSRF